MKVPYLTRGSETPAPALQVQLIHPDTMAKVAIMARIDCGADIITIPFISLDTLNLVAVGRTFTAGYDDLGKSHYLFACNLRFRSFSFENIKVIAALTPEVLIGLDILNQMHVCLNGPQKQLEFVEKRARSRPRSRR